MLPGGGGWTYLLEAATFYTSPDAPDDAGLLDGLPDGLEVLATVVFVSLGTAATAALSWNFVERRFLLRRQSASGSQERPIFDREA